MLVHDRRIPRWDGRVHPLTCSSPWTPSTENGLNSLRSVELLPRSIFPWPHTRQRRLVLSFRMDSITLLNWLCIYLHIAFASFDSWMPKLWCYSIDRYAPYPIFNISFIFADLPDTVTWLDFPSVPIAVHMLVQLNSMYILFDCCPITVWFELFTSYIGPNYHPRRTPRGPCYSDMLQGKPFCHWITQFIFLLAIQGSDGVPVL
jgi:hypothetical protein